MATERYTCHDDGVTDCPCKLAEKTIKLIGMTVSTASCKLREGQISAIV